MATNKINLWLIEAVESVLDSDETTPLILVLDGVKLPPERNSWISHPRISVIELKSSTGLADALNTGLDAVKTEFTARLDADDIALPNRFLWQAKYLQENEDVVLVGGVSQIVNEEGALLGNSLPRDELLNVDIRHHLLERNSIVHPAVMYRTEVIKQMRGYSPGLKSMEDYELWLRVAQRGRIVIADSAAIRYRVHNSQMSLSAAPFGRHIYLITLRRMTLAKFLGVSQTKAMILALAWAGFQYWRFLKTTLNRFIRGH